MSWASAAIQFWQWALVLVDEGAFPQEGIADAVRYRAEAEIARHSVALVPTPQRDRYGPSGAGKPA